jgi:glycosyltransferase involved in cell wall biosynthesis
MIKNIIRKQNFFRSIEVENEMNILFMTAGSIENIEDQTIYCDLLRCFRNHGHEIYVLCIDKKNQTKYIEQEKVRIRHVPIHNLTETNNLIRKGIATISVETIFIKTIKKYFGCVRFDLVMCSTPPITFGRAVSYIKKRDRAKTYLLLKDIFPQNAVDLEMLKKNGLKGMVYKWFRYKEKKLYLLSDFIGCMSEANMEYVLQHNPEVDKSKVEICPNSIEVKDLDIGTEEYEAVRLRYNIPKDRIVFIYGGNLGKPQGIEFMLKCLHSQRENKELFFLIVGNGTEYSRIQEYIEQYKPENISLYQWISKEEYSKLLSLVCDVGLIFLDHRFTIPNFPSRLLGYMQAKLPVLAVTDSNTDIGKVIEDGEFGWWCESNDVNLFMNKVNQIISSDFNSMGKRAFHYLKNHYDVEYAYETIMMHF